MKKFFKKIAVYFVTAHAKRIYESAVRCAEYKHEQTGRRVFVITNQEDSKELLVITDKEFREMRNKIGITSKECRLVDLAAGAWYYTANEKGNAKLREYDLEVRKRAFIKDSLQNANLI